MKKFKNPWDLKSGFLVFGLMIFLSFLVPILFDSLSLLLILFGLSLLFFISSLVVVNEPEKAILFRFGNLEAELAPGWYLTIWPIHTVQIETTALQILNDGEKEKEKQELYTKQKTAITVFMRVPFRLVNLEQALKRYGGLSTPTSRKDIESTAFSALRAVVGNSDFSQLTSEESKIEREVENIANKKLKNNGYIIEGLDIYDYTEEVVSEAARIEEIAKAKGKEAREFVKATSDLKDNYPGAIATSVGMLTTTAREINQQRIKAGKRPEERISEKAAEEGLIESIKKILKGG